MLDLPAGPDEHEGDDDGDRDDDRSSGPRFEVSRITGTPMYMAPEQRRRGTLDARADQFAFGVSGWELLYKQWPFVGEDARAYAESTVEGRFRPTPANTPVPTWVRRVLVRCMAASPADRYRTMDEAIAALSADPARRWRTALGVAAVAGIAGALAFGLRGAADAPTCEDAERHLAGTWDATRAGQLDAAFRATGAAFASEASAQVRAALDRRTAAWAAMHREACIATRVTGEQSAAMLDLRMACLDRRRQELRALVDQLVLTPDTSRVAVASEAVAGLPSVAGCADLERLLATPPPDDPMQHGAIIAARGELATISALELTGQWPAARQRAEHVQGVARSLAWPGLIAEAGLVRARAEKDAGAFAAAEAALQETITSAARAHADELLTQAYGELAWVVGYEQSRASEGLAYAIAADAAATRASAPAGELATIAHTRAQILSNAGEQDAALREAERAQELYSQPGAEDPDLDALNTIAMIRSAQGDYARAEAAHRDVLARRRADLGDGHPKVADSLDNLGVARFHQGAVAEARADYEQALAMRIAALGPDHRDVGTSHNNLGGLLMDTGDDAGAEQHLEAALRIYERALGADHGDLAIPLSNLGELATRRRDFARALALCTRARALDEATAPDDPKVAYDLVCIGEAELGRGRPAAALAPLERALHLREGSEGDVVELAQTRLALARALWRTGDRSRALALAGAARDALVDAEGALARTRRAEIVTWLARPS